MDTKNTKYEFQYKHISIFFNFVGDFTFTDKDKDINKMCQLVTIYTVHQAHEPCCQNTVDYFYQIQKKPFLLGDPEWCHNLFGLI